MKSARVKVVSVFALIAGLALCVVVPLGLQAFRGWKQGAVRQPPRHPFPWWGQAGLALSAVS